MREIKFRGMTLPGYWAVGLLSKSTGLSSQPDEGYYISNKSGMPWAFSVRPDTVGQFTDLKDKNGVEIYEGDILKCKDRVLTPVTWRRCGFIGLDILAELQDPGLKNTEVIGNIYENPELIIKEQTYTPMTVGFKAG